MLISVKLAPTYDYPVLAEFWRTADQLGFHGIWDYDHFYGLVDPQQPTYEGWTTLAAMAAWTTNSRVGCLVGSVTYHNPALLAKMAVTIDHISGGRAGWNVVTTGNPETALNFGKDDHMEHGERYRRAREFFDVVTGLWDSFADDAFVRELRAAGLSLARIAEHTGYSRSQVCRILARPVA